MDGRMDGWTDGTPKNVVILVTRHYSTH